MRKKRSLGKRLILQPKWRMRVIKDKRRQVKHKHKDEDDVR